MTKLIELTKGQFAIVDDSDYEYLSKFKWYAKERKHTWYAARRSGLSEVRMHRVILNVGAGIEVDHINGNGLDNRRANLRPVTKSENAQNRMPRGNSASGFKGVYLRSDGKKWQASIMVNRKQIFLGGNFETAERAARA